MSLLLDSHKRDIARKIERERDARPAYTPSKPIDAGSADAAPARAIHLTKASTIKPRPVRWLWKDRAALGTLTLVGGREGIGKSILVYSIVADITRGRLEGDCYGTPRAVIIVATEDSWEHTIVPRLMAAGADLDRVYRVDVATSDLMNTTLSLPRDIANLEEAIREVNAAALVLDPLLSRLDVKLDSHKDQQVRLALEPLVAIADRTRLTQFGLIHVNKSDTNDPLSSLMGSRAFAAVARSVLFVMTDPDDENTRLLGTPKNNLGRLDLPTLSFRIDGAKVAQTEEGEVWTGKLVWTGQTTRTIRDALEATAATSGDRTATTEAADWLQDYLTQEGGAADSAGVKKAGAAAGHSIDAIKRARKRLNIAAESKGFPRKTYWFLPPASVGAPPRETLIAPTAPTAPTESQSGQSVQSAQLEMDDNDAPTEVCDAHDIDQF